MDRSVAIEITDYEVRALWFSGKKISKRKPSLTVAAFDRIPIPAGVIRQGQILDSPKFSQLLKEFRLKHFPAGKVQTFIGLPWQLGFVRNYQLPWFPNEKRSQAIRFFMEEEAPIPAGDLLYDTYLLGEQDGSSLEIMAGAVKKSILESYINSLEHSGFQVEGADFAISAITKAIPFHPNENVLYLQADHLTLHAVLYQGKKPEVYRTFQGITDQTWPKECSHELERILLYFTSQHPEFSLNRILLAGEPVGREIAEVLTKSLSQAPLIQELFSASESLYLDSTNSELTEFQHTDFQHKDFPHTELSGTDFSPIDYRHNAPVAYAVAANVFSGRKGLNLWRKRQEQRQKVHKLVFGLLPVALIVIFGTVLLVSPLVKEKQLRAELTRLQPEGLKIEKIRQQENELLAQWMKLQKHPLNVGQSLAQIENQRITGLTLKEIQYKQGGLFINGSAQKAAQVEALMQFLRNAEWENPTFSSYLQKEDNLIEFGITARKSS